MNYLRKELYKLIKKEEYIFDFIQESSLDGLWYWDLENPDELWLNVKFWTTLGYNPAEMPHKSSAWEQVVFQEDFYSAREDLQKHLSDPSFSYNREVRYRHKDGSTVWICCRAFAIRDKKGKPIRVLGAHIDLTELKHKEQLLTETNRVARVGAWEVDLMHNTVYWSEVTKEIHEVAPDFVPDLATGINFYKEGESRIIITKCIGKAIEKGEAFDVELQIVTAKNTIIWVRAIGQPEFYEGVCGRIFGVFQDINTRKIAEKKLTESEEQFRQTFEYAVTGMALVDKRGIWTRVNDSFCQLVGYSREELLKLGFQDLTHPDDLKESIKELQELARGERKVYIKEKRYIHKNGQVLWLIIGVSKVTNAEGKTLHYVAQYSDITERKRTEEKLIASEQYFRQTFENAVVGMALVNPNRQFEKVNKSFCRFIGYTKKELLQMQIDDLVTPEKLQQNLKKLPKWESGELESHISDREFIHKKGHKLWATVSVSTVKDGNGDILQYIIQFSDITDRKIAEEKLQTERTFLQTLIDNLPVNVYVKDLASRKTMVNKMELKHMGNKNLSQIIGKDETAIYPKESAKISKKEDLAVFTTGQPLLNKETLNVKLDGTKTWFLTSKIPLFDSNGKIDSLLGISYDITKFKDAEEKILRYSILETKTKEMEQFSYIVSHDLREPLATLKGYLNLLLEEFGGAMPEDAQDILQFSVDGANRMDELIHGLLNYSRLSQVKELVQLNSNKVVSEVLADLSATIVKNKVVFEIDQLPMLLAYPLEFKQLFQNLISNAIKFRKKDIPPAIQIHCTKVHDGWQFMIKDNGIGIPATHKEQIFQIFQRLNKDLEGAGLGLAYCKKIVELHNGNIWVESKLGEGSTFYFTILTEG